MAKIDVHGIRAVVFDLYGTLIEARFGGVRYDPDSDPILMDVLTSGQWKEGIEVPIPEMVLKSPSRALERAVCEHHASSQHPYPEVDLRKLWSQLLELPGRFDAGPLVVELHGGWNPASWLPGAREAIRRAHGARLLLGILSNAQWDTRQFLGEMRGCFEPDLMMFSFEHGIAKPSPELFHGMKARLADRGIAAGQTYFVGNDPLQDIRPAAKVGFKPVHFMRRKLEGPADEFHSAASLGDWADFLAVS